MCKSIIDKMKARNAGPSHVQQMQKRGESSEGGEGKFIDKVAARNVGESYVTQMQARAEREGKGGQGAAAHRTLR